MGVHRLDLHQRLGHRRRALAGLPHVVLGLDVILFVVRPRIPVLVEMGVRVLLGGVDLRILSLLMHPAFVLVGGLADGDMIVIRAVIPLMILVAIVLVAVVAPVVLTLIVVAVALVQARLDRADARDVARRGQPR